METDSQKKKIFEYYRTHRSVEFMETCNKDKAWEKLYKHICMRRVQRTIFRTKVAAAIVLLIASSVWGYIIFHPQEQQPATVTLPLAQAEHDGAILILHDGQQINLQSKDGIIEVPNGNAEIVNNSMGELLYKAFPKHSDTLRYNTLIIPRGGEYRLQLADGTQVWLNSESSLKYPESFAKDSREIILTGEAYFEVAKDSKRPFKVHTSDCEVTVLGTHFNVSAYTGQPVYTTLAEGSVQVKTDSEAIILKPDEQAVLSDEGLEVHQVDASLYISWVHGKYVFRNTTLENVVQQICRWYDTDIRFSDETLKSKRIAGAISRDETLTTVLQLLEQVAEIHFIHEKDDSYVMKRK